MTALLSGIASEAVAQPREKCVQERTVAQNQYLQGRFDEAITLLQQCLDREALFVDEAVQVYRLLSLVYLNSGDLGRAQQAIRDLLQKAPAYQADPVQDPPSYNTMVVVIRQEIEAQAQADSMAVSSQEVPETVTEEPETHRPEPPPRFEEPAVTSGVARPPTAPRRRMLRRPKSWLLATGGAVVIATAVALAFGGSAESNPAPPR